jgi:hypothetical protein
MQIYPGNTLTFQETFLTKTLLGYVKATDNLPVTSTTRYNKGGIYATDAQLANYISLNNPVTMRDDITTATTANSLTTYSPSVSTALITQKTFYYSLLTGSSAIYPNASAQIWLNGVVSTSGVPAFCINNPITGGNILSGNPQLIGYKIQMDPIAGPIGGFTNIFAANTYITSIDVYDIAQTNKFAAWVTLSIPNIAVLPSGTINYPIQIIANNLTLSTTTFSNPFNINYDTYLNMTLQNIPVVTTNHNQKPCTFKIPLNSQGNIVYLNGESNSFDQVATIDNSSFVLDKLTVVFTDRRGNPIQPNYGNYSFSLGFEFGSGTSSGTTNGNSGVPGTAATGTPSTVPIKRYFQEFM